MSNNQKKRIVILGGGFGGIYTYLGLKKYFKPSEVEIIIVNRTNYFLFTPLLHEVATGGLNAQHVVEPIRKIIRSTGADLYQAEVKSVDLKKQKIETSLGDISYDYLVIALGATTNFYNTPGAERHSFVLKDLANATKLRNYFIDSFEHASKLKTAKERKQALQFAIVGGGPTGVELAAEMAELFLDTFEKYYENFICADHVKLYLLHRDKELLMQFHPQLRARALKLLDKKLVHIKLEAGVTEITDKGITLSDGTFLPVTNVIWTAGVKPNTPSFLQDVKLDKQRRIVVDEYLHVEGYNNVFAIGDVASVTDTHGQVLPMLAQVARKQGDSVAGNIRAITQGNPLMKFIYRSKGSLVSLGQWKALGNIAGLRWSGPIAWFIWRTTYLLNFASWSKRIKIAVDWTVNLFAPRDITKA